MSITADVRVAPMLCQHSTRSGPPVYAPETRYPMKIRIGTAAQLLAGRVGPPLRSEMSLARWTLLAGILAVGVVTIAAMSAQTQTAGGRPPGTNYQRPAFTFNKIANGVY